VEEGLPPLLPPISGKASTGKYQIPENSNDEFRIFYMKQVDLHMFRTVFPNLFDVAVPLTSLFISHGTP